MRRWVIPAVALVVVLLLSADGWAASPTEQLRGFFTAATRVLDGPEAQGRPEQQLSTIRAMVGGIFDFREAAQLSLGSDWNARTSAEREEFVRLFADFLERALILGIATRIQVADGVKVSYLGEAVDGALASVWTTIAIKSGLDLPFNYRMIERGDRWAVRDVVIDGVSLAANYRAQFTRVIQASSYLGLVQQMKARVSRPPTPLQGAIGVADVRAPAPVRPVAPPPADLTRKESAELTSRPALPETLPAVQSHEVALEVRLPRRQLPDAVPVAWAPPAPPPIAANSAPQDGSARRKSEPARPLGEGRLLPNQLHLVMVPRPVSARASSAKSYWVQVGAFKNPESARRLAALLSEQEAAGSNRWAVIVGTAFTDGQLARVRVGPFPGRAEAASTLRELKGRGYTPFIAEERD